MPLSLKDLGLVDAAFRFGGSYIMSLDAGTTSVRAVIVDEFGGVVAQASRPLGMHYPHPGWVEQDPTEILASMISVIVEVQFKSGIHSEDIAAVGISNQRETCIVWDRESGQPVYNAIGWQCRRTADAARTLADPDTAAMIRSKTGLTPDAYFSATKVAWILDNVAGAREMADAGKLVFGTVDTWLIYSLTGGAVIATDYTNASRTMLFNIRTLDWDDDLLALFGIPRAMMPELKWSSDDYGHVSHEIMSHRPPITGVAGDQQASLFGHCCFRPGEVKNTYGTGCFLLMNTGDEVVESSEGLVATVGIAEGGRVSYALEGSIFHAGSVVRWLRDGLGIIDDVQSTAEVARSCATNDGCYLVPAFSGLGAPWWDADARGLICGLTAASTRSTIVRAACESLAYQVYDVLRAMERAAGCELSELRVDGGASRNDFIMQFQADLLKIPVVQSESVETTAIGAAYLAGLSVGYWENREELLSNCAVAERFSPALGDEAEELRLRNLHGWHDAVKRSRSTVA